MAKPPPGWYRASDGRFYSLPPHLQRAAGARVALPPRQRPVDRRPPKERGLEGLARSMPVWLRVATLAVLGVGFVGLMVASALAPGPETVDTTASAPEPQPPRTTEQTTSAEHPTTTERPTTTTTAALPTTTAPLPTTTTTADPFAGLTPAEQAALDAYFNPPAPPQPPSGGGCNPNYSGCVPNASDVDCIGGSGNGPAYTGYTTMIGVDVYGLDGDGDGQGCE